MTALEDRLARRFELHTYRFHHRDFHAELIAPRWPDALIDASDINVDERLPYWAELWPSARALAIELLERRPPAGPVLELGCGLALPSLALLSQGVPITASDYYSESLEFAVANALRNGLPAPDTLLFDWRSPPADLPSFSLVIAADVLYERRNAETLADLLPRLASPGTTFLFADPGRAHAPRFRTLFERNGGRVAEVGVREVEGATEGRTAAIHILEMTVPDAQRAGPKL